ncbi:MAG: hypothetical protein LBN08_01690 [Lactobacillales bacterium]|jgi:hypothetical protein|nr:hypothetical protein [Lactobacillales bacterium]
MKKLTINIIAGFFIVATILTLGTPKALATRNPLEGDIYEATHFKVFSFKKGEDNPYPGAFLSRWYDDSKYDYRCGVVHDENYMEVWSSLLTSAGKTRYSNYLVPNETYTVHIVRKEGVSPTCQLKMYVNFYSLLALRNDSHPGDFNIENYEKNGFTLLSREDQNTALYTLTADEKFDYPTLEAILSGVGEYDVYLSKDADIEETKYYEQKMAIRDASYEAYDQMDKSRAERKEFVEEKIKEAEAVDEVVKPLKQAILESDEWQQELAAKAEWRAGFTNQITTKKGQIDEFNKLIGAGDPNAPIYEGIIEELEADIEQLGHEMNYPNFVWPLEEKVAAYDMALSVIVYPFS